VSRERELREMREEAGCPERAAALEASRRAVAAWQREHPVGLDEVLDTLAWIHERFGEPPVDRRPFRGDDFRL